MFVGLKINLHNLANSFLFEFDQWPDKRIVFKCMVVLAKEGLMSLFVALIRWKQGNEVEPNDFAQFIVLASLGSGVEAQCIQEFKGALPKVAVIHLVMFYLFHEQGVRTKGI
jgi:hypothetical protein